MPLAARRPATGRLRVALVVGATWITSAVAGTGNAAPVVPEPVFVQDAGADDGQLTVTPAAAGLASGPGIWRLDVTNGGDVTLTLQLDVTTATADDDGSPQPGDPSPWAAAPTATLQVAAGEVAQFGIAVDPPDDFDGLLLARLSSVGTEPSVVVDAVAAVGGFSDGPVSVALLPEDAGRFTRVWVASSDARPALVDVEVRRRGGLLGLQTSTVARFRDVVVDGTTPRVLDLGPDADVHAATAVSAGNVTEVSHAPGVPAVGVGIAGAAALLGGGTVIWLRRRSRGQAPSAPASPS